MVDLRKLEIQIEKQFDHQVALLKTILKTIDHIVEENKQQGEDLSNNTKAIRLMEVDIDEIRKKINKQEQIVENAAESGAENAVKEALPHAINKGINSIIESGKKLSLKKPGRFRLNFWGRG